jgi:hypothetical protein
MEELLHDDYHIRHTTLQVDHARGGLLQIGRRQEMTAAPPCPAHLPQSPQSPARLAH